LYGSVATGKAKSPASDLDIIVVLNRKPIPKLKNELKELELLLSKKYKRIFREVGLGITFKNEILRGKEAYGLKFFLTTLSVRIYGDNLFQTIMKYNPTKKLASSLHSDIEKILE